jgi:hypothetical protein
MSEQQSDEEQLVFKLKTKHIEIAIVILTLLLLPLIFWASNMAYTIRDNELKVKTLEQDLESLKDKLQKIETDTAVNKQSITGIDKQLDGVSKTLSGILDKL